MCSVGECALSQALWLLIGGESKLGTMPSRSAPVLGAPCQCRARVQLQQNKMFCLQPGPEFLGTIRFPWQPSESNQFPRLGPLSGPWLSESLCCRGALGTAFPCPYLFSSTLSVVIPGISREAQSQISHLLSVGAPGSDGGTAQLNTQKHSSSWLLVGPGG